MPLARVGLAFAAVLALASCARIEAMSGAPPDPAPGAAPAATGTEAAAPVSAHPTTTELQDNLFLSAALARTEAEIDQSQMVAQKGAAPAVVRYAKQVADHRTGLRDRLVTLAGAGGVSADPNIISLHDDLAPLSGDAFERAYLAAQIEDQQNNLDFFQTEAARGENPALRQLAADQVAQLQQDLADALTTVRALPLEDTSKSQQNLPPGLGPGPGPMGMPMRRR